MNRKICSLGLVACLLAGCTSSTTTSPSSTQTKTSMDSTAVETTLDQIDMTKWQYNQEDDVY